MLLHGLQKMSPNQLLVSLLELLHHLVKEWVTQEQSFLVERELQKKNLLLLKRQESLVQKTLQNLEVCY